MKNNSDDMSMVLKISRCLSCGSYGFPHDVYACRVCGESSDKLVAEKISDNIFLVNFVTVKAAIIKNIPIPFVVGEVQLAPGVIEEAIISVKDESVLRLGMPLYPVRNTDESIDVRWFFSPDQQHEVSL